MPAATITRREIDFAPSAKGHAGAKRAEHSLPCVGYLLPSLEPQLTYDGIGKDVQSAATVTALTVASLTVVGLFSLLFFG